MSTIRTWACPKLFSEQHPYYVYVYDGPGECQVCGVDRIAMLLLPESEARDWVPSQKGRVLLIDAPEPRHSAQERLLDAGWWKAIDADGCERWISPGTPRWRIEEAINRMM